METKTITVIMSAQMYQQIKDTLVFGKTVSDVVREAITQYLEAKEV
jgi:Arc/MetJ-type ribon-helix-helix transcriptional regulator